MYFYIRLLLLPGSQKVCIQSTRANCMLLSRAWNPTDRLTGNQLGSTGLNWTGQVAGGQEIVSTAESTR